MDHHTLAIVCIIGSSLDVLGALYLAYDLLGGEHGPLRTLSRAVTYGALFAVGSSIPLGVEQGPLLALSRGLRDGAVFFIDPVILLGPNFSIACGVTDGFSLA